MTPTLAGTAALVTGASSGIGAATAKALAAQGAAVALLARRADRLADLKTDIESAGGTAFVVAADVTDAEQVAGAVQLTVEELGRLDTVVNNAGLMQSGPAAEAPLRDWDEMVAVNIQGVLYITHAALPHLIDAAEISARCGRPGHHQFHRRLGGPPRHRGLFADQVRGERFQRGCPPGGTRQAGPRWRCGSRNRGYRDLQPFGRTIA
jgi:NADP-dependent 3-hydroxy acid dehydrogenase YdfG